MIEETKLYSVKKTGRRNIRRKSLNGAEQLLRLLVSGVEDYAIFVLDPKGYILSWNSGAQKLKGYTNEEIVGRHFSCFYTSADLAIHHPQKELEIAKKVGKYQEEGWRVKKDGSLFWANILITALKDPDGTLRGFAKVTRDLTERKVAEEKLQQSEERLRLMIQNVQDYAIFMLDLEGRVTSWNEGAHRLKGYEAKEILGQHFSKFYISNDPNYGKPEFDLKEAARLGSFEDEGWRVRKAGSQFWANVLITAICDFKNQLIGFTVITRDLTNSRKVEEARLKEAQNALILKETKQSEKILDQLFSQSPSFMALLSVPEYRYVKSNERYQQLVKRTNIIGKVITEVLPQAETSCLRQLLDNVVATGEPCSVIERLSKFENSKGENFTAYIDAVYHPMRHSDGHLYAIAVQGYDVTEKVLSKNAANKALKDNQTLLNVSPSFFWLINPESGALTVCNDLSLKIIEKTRDEVFDKPFWDCPWWKSLPISAALIEESIKKAADGISSEFDIQYWSSSSYPEGQIRWMNFRSSPVRNQFGLVEQVAVSGVEITEQKKATEGLRASELRYRTLTDALPQLIWTGLPDGKCDYLSKQWVQYTGLEEKEQLGLEWLKAVHPDDRKRVHEEWIGAVKGLHPYDVEYRIRRYDGEYRWFKARGTAIRNQAGESIYWFGTCTDIEDQRRNLEVLKILNEVGPSIIAELDLQRVVQLVTDTATNLTGAEFGAFFYNVMSAKGESYMLYTLSGALKETFSNFSMPRKTNLFAPTFDGKGTVRSDDIRKDPRYGKNAPYYGLPLGHLPVVSYLAVPVISRTGEVIGGLFFGHSRVGAFTKEAEEISKGLASRAAIAIDNARLYQQSKDAVRARDEFLSIASHELKTPLTGMRIQTQMFNRSVAKNSAIVFEPPKVKQIMGVIDKGINRLIRLVDDMLDISRIQIGKLNLHPEAVDLAGVIREAMERFQPELSNAGIHLNLDLRSGVVCNLDRFRFEQVLTNLSTNAIRYAPRAPLTIKLTQEENFAILRFRDHGPGIPKIHQDQVFKRFERLVSANEVSGMGLGLFISREIIESHGGSIKVEYKVRPGACFVIRLPLQGKGNSS